MNFALGARAARVNRTPGSRHLEHSITSADVCWFLALRGLGVSHSCLKSQQPCEEAGRELELFSGAGTG